MTEKQKNDVYSFLIPMQEDHLLVPNSLVAEIVPFMNVTLFDGIEASNDWNIGKVVWRNQSIPVIALERIQGQQDLGEVRRARIAIVYTLQGNQQVPHVALLVRGVPRLVPVTEDNSQLLESQPSEDAVAAWVQVEGKKAQIPDLKVLEQMVADL